MSTSICRLVIVSLLAASTARAALTNGDFEAAPFNSGWSGSGAVVSDGFAPGSSQAARFTGGGQSLRRGVNWSSDWHLDFWFMVRATSDRQFSLIIDTGSSATTLNLRYQGGWYTFAGGSWGSPLALADVLPTIDQNGDGDADDAGDTKNVYHMRVTGKNWGTASASYDLELSDANGSAFTSSVTGLTRYQGGFATSMSPSRFRFGTEFGGNPGFWIDDVSTHEDAPPGNPASIAYFVADGNELSWEASGATTLTLDPGGIDVSGLSSFPVSPATTQTFTLSASSPAGSDSKSFTIGVGEPQVSPIISEFLAINPAGDDWVEIHNPNSFSLNLRDWSLSDDPLEPDKSSFAPTAIDPGGYLLLSADELGFSLASQGEFLGLFDPDGLAVAEFSPTYPPQFSGVSYGALPGGSYAYLGNPTPGQANQPSPYLADYSAERQPDGSVLVSVLAGSSAAPLTSVSLIHRTMYDAEVSIAMSDLGDGNHQAIIPAGVTAAGEMLRWRIVATEGGGLVAKLPPFPSPTNSPEYFGTVIPDPTLTSNLQILHWFQNGGGSETRAGTRCSLYWNGELYDNVLVHLRGATTASLEKKPHQFEFNPGHNFRIAAGVPRVDQINVNAAYPDSSYLRDVLPMENLATMGVPAPDTFPVRVERNGAFHSLGIMIEQPDNEFLRRHDDLLDPGGALFKATGNGSWLISASGFEARNNSNLADLSAFTTSLNGGDQLDFLLENIDLPSVVNYLAVNVVDSIFNPQKNYYLHQNRFGEWMILPWDRDFSYGHRWLGSGDPRGSSGPTTFLVTDERYEWGGSNDDFKGGYNRLFDAIFDHPATSEMFYRRLRTAIDTLLAPGVIEARIEGLRLLMKPEADLDRATWGFTNNGSYRRFPQESFDAALDRIKTIYLPARRDFLENDGGTPVRGTLPSSQPASPTITFGQIVTNPASGDQDEESIELHNPNAFAVDLSGWTLTGGVTHTLRPGTVIPAGASLFLSPDVPTFRATKAPAFAQGNYDGHLSNFSETLTLSQADGTVIATTTTPNTPSNNQRFLRISEIMYHPPGDGEEFIELLNTSDTETLSLGGVAFTAGITYTFPEPTTLAPGARIVIGFADFETGRLSNGGERLKLEDADGSTIAEFAYDDQHPWPESPDGSGPSLVFRGGDPQSPQNWRPSLEPGGNPGSSDSIEYAGGELLDYAFAGSAQLSLGENLIMIERNPGADDVEIIPEWSTDLQNWDSSGFEFRSEGTWQIPEPAAPRQFLRFKVRLR